MSPSHGQHSSVHENSSCRMRMQLVGVVLSQDQGQGNQPVAFTSCKMNSHERNYAAHEKETLAIMHALSKWRVYLEGRPFTIFTDHATLQHFPEQPNLSR